MTPDAVKDPRKMRVTGQPMHLILEPLHLRGIPTWALRMTGLLSSIQPTRKPTTRGFVDFLTVSHGITTKRTTDLNRIWTSYVTQSMFIAPHLTLSMIATYSTSYVPIDRLTKCGQVCEGCRSCDGTVPKQRSSVNNAYIYIYITGSSDLTYTPNPRRHHCYAPRQHG